VLAHLPPLLLLAALSIVWTWPLVLHFGSHVPGPGGDNYGFLWNLWWMRTALSATELEFFQSRYLFSPFGIDLINHPHAALQGFVSATVLGRWSLAASLNLYVIVSVFLNAACAYALAFDLVRRRQATPARLPHWGSRRIALLTGVAFGGSPYVAAHLLGQFDLLTAWVVPLFALCLRRSLRTGSVAAATGCGLCAAAAAYAAYDHMVYLAVFAVTYTFASWHAGGLHRLQRPAPERFWRGAQALMITAATFALLSLPLIAQAFRLVLSNRYTSQTSVWRSGAHGIDALAPFAGNPFHPLYGRVVSWFYEYLGLDRIEGVGWLGIVPVIVLLTGRGTWLDTEEARRWKAVLLVFAIWALGSSLTIAGFETALPLPQALWRFVPLGEIAWMPGRAMVCVYLALGVLMALRVAGLASTTTGTTKDVVPTDVVPTFRSALARPAIHWVLVVLLAFDYLHAPIPLTALDRPAVYEQLASITDNGAVIEVPLGIGDVLLTGRAAGDRRLLYNATIHGHPLVGGYIDRMPPQMAQAYDAMPVVGNLLRLSNGEEAIDDNAPVALLPFRYLVLDTNAATPALIDYVRRTLDMDLISSGAGKQLFAVQGVRPANIRASR
jgi:hypothetical protein